MLYLCVYIHYQTRLHGPPSLNTLADLPVSQFLLIAIINGGTQWACVCMGAAIVPQEIFEFVTIKIFKKITKNVHETDQFQL